MTLVLILCTKLISSNKAACCDWTFLLGRIFSSDIHNITIAASWSLELQRHSGCRACVWNTLSDCWLAVWREWVAIHKDFYKCHILLPSGKQTASVIGVFYPSIVAHFYCNIDKIVTVLKCCTENIWATRCRVRALWNFGSVLRDWTSWREVLVDWRHWTGLINRLVITYQ